MTFEPIKAEKTIRRYGNRVFYFFVIEENDSISLFIQEEGYGIISHCVGVPKENPVDFVPVINQNLEDYVSMYDEQMAELNESSAFPQLVQ